MANVVLSVLSRRAVKVVTEVLLTAAGELMAQLCAASSRLDDKRRLAVLKRQLEVASENAGRWHLRAMDLQAYVDAMEDIACGPKTAEETFPVKRFTDKQTVN